MLTRRTQTERKPDHFANVFSTTIDPKRRTDKDEDKKVKAILGRLHHYGITTMDESNAIYALQSHSAKTGPPDSASEAAFRLLLLLQETCDGVVIPYNPSTKLLGAVNRESVTCFLDSLLFAMFARLDSFEALLYNNYEDGKRKRLAGMLRLWVNMLRSGKLIPTDVVRFVLQMNARVDFADGTSRQSNCRLHWQIVDGPTPPSLSSRIPQRHSVSSLASWSSPY